MSDIRETVAEAYTNALRKSQESAPPPACCAPALDQTVDNSISGLAGYTDEEKGEFGDALQSSFGCGNPLAFSGVKAGDTVVDLGSGAGLDLLIAADKVGPSGHVIGVDMTDAMLDAARANAAKAGKTNVELRKGYIEDLPIEAGTVDWVISNCVVNLSPDKDTVFAEIARVLKPGGQFSISDIVVEDLPEWIRNNTAAYSACVAGAISEEDYLAGLRKAGLVDVEVTERLVYDRDQILAMASTELSALGLDTAVIEAGLDAVEGKAWSAKVVGRKA